jgi:hypothetical protein
MARLPGVGNCRNIAVAVSLGQKLLDNALLTLAALFPSRAGGRRLPLLPSMLHNQTDQGMVRVDD